MSEVKTVLYEGLFLMGQSAGADMAASLELIREVLNRAEAEIITLHKWDERKLAYTIKGQKRGTYILSVFKARTTQIANIERDCNLSEQIVRALILRADHMGDIELDQARELADTAATRQAMTSAEGDEPEAPAADEAPAPAETVEAGAENEAQ